jgi:hypothetical protein
MAWENLRFLEGGGGGVGGASLWQTPSTCGWADQPHVLGAHRCGGGGGEGGGEEAAAAAAEERDAARSREMQIEAGCCVAKP